MPMRTPPHPGMTVLHDCIEPLGLSITNAASALGVSRNSLSELVNGKRGISPEMAIRLEKVFGASMEDLMRMQNNYEIALARQHQDEINVARYVPQITTDAQPKLI